MPAVAATPTAVPLLVTRAEDDAVALVPRLLSHGFAPVVAPCLRYIPIDVERLPPPRERPDLLVSSPRSVAVAARFADGRRVHALVPRTARDLAACGVPIRRRVPGGAAELVAGVDPKLAVLLTSDLGVERAKRWPDLLAVATHRTAAAEALPDVALSAMKGEFDLLFASPSAVDAFARLAPGQIVRARRVRCHGTSTLVAARKAGARDPEPFDVGE
jgi:uroporphyrinogen-III synthase